MACPRCGADVGDSGTCPGCGAPVTGAPVVSPESSATSGSPAPSTDDVETQFRSAPGSPDPSSTDLRPGARFGSRYTIIRVLGTGGMGSVYQAWDESLGIPVALKTIRSDPGLHPLDARELEERLKRELKLARQITHQNVIRIHDLGELGSTKYLTMAYVHGGDLSSLLRTHGKLPPERALPLARQIAAGLAAAHDAGVVHRDLKPANVLVDGDHHALLTDFGIARATESATVHTFPGAIIGTFGYMAPEQARGEVADKRSDAYSFGLILHEMLAGPRLRGTVPAIRDVAPEVPADLERIVTRCLEPNPADRYQDAREILADLERLGPDGRLVTPVRRDRRGWPVALVAAAVVLAVLMAWRVAGPLAPAAPAPTRAPVSVLIADFENRAGDPVFEGSLEQALGIGIEGAPFITAFSRKAAVELAATLTPSQALTRDAAQLVAVREGIAVVLAGAIERQDAGYRLRLAALRTAPQDTITTLEATAPDKSAVLEAMTDLAKRVRRALGDTSPSAALQAETFSTGSLEAVHEYSVAQDLTTDSRNEEAVAHYRAAVAHDPRFGRAYAGWAACAYDLGRRAEAEELWNKALSLMDRMTERERYRTLGGYFLTIARNYDKAIENYRELVTQYPADLAGRNNLAIAYFYTRDFERALEEGRRAIDIYPKSLKFRTNYALYAMYAGDFRTAVDNARQVLERDRAYDSAYLPLAMASAADGDIAGARAVYERARGAGAPGMSLAAVGLADLAIFEGRFDDAIQILETGIPQDRAAENSFGVATKSVALVEALIASGQVPAAARTAEQALSLSNDEFVAVVAARAYSKAKRDDKVAALADELAKRSQPLPGAYAKIIEGERLLERGRIPDAIARFAEGARLADVWLARFDLGIAYVLAGRHAEALAELDACRKRRGEATAIFLDDLPTWRFTAALPYWTGRAQQGLGMMQGARASLEQFVRARASAAGDAMVDDARRRLSTLQPAE